MSYEHVLDELEIGTDPFALCQLRGRCDMVLPRAPAVTLHYVLAGEGEVTTSGQPPVRVGSGSMVLIPALHSHVLRSFGGRSGSMPACRPAELGLEAHLAEGAETSDSGLLVLCVRINLGLRGACDLIDLVRAPLAETIPAASKLAGIVGRLLDELCTPRLGSRAMLRTLLLECMIELLRNRFEAGDPALRWMAALHDRSIWAALRAVLERPAAPHSVESLAAIAGLGRSTFAKRFSAAYGSGPMELLRDLRMRMAADLLTRTDLPVARIAGLSGFRSRSAFTRTFAAATGASPGAYRAAGEQA